MNCISIQLQELQNLDRTSLSDLVKKNKYNRLSFLIPKRTAICLSDHHDIMSEYMLQFFIAQKFEHLLTQFSYIPPPLHKKTHFIYSGIPKNFKELDDYLFKLVQALCNDDNKIDLQLAATEFFAHASYDEVVCYEYFIIAAQFLLISNEN